MEFADVIERVMEDERAHKIPILYVVQILIICDDLKLFGGNKDEFTT